MKRIIRQIILLLMQFLKTFFLIFGIIEFLLFCQHCTPQYARIGNIQYYSTVYAIWASILFAAAHMTLNIEELDNLITMKVRCFLFLLLCVGGSGFVSWELGVQNWLSIVEGISKPTAILLFYSEWVISAIVILGVMGFVERRYRKIGKEYTAALEGYKEKYNTIH